MRTLLEHSWKVGMSYEAYKSLIAELVEQNMTSGPNQTQELADFTKLNQARMDRIDKQAAITPEMDAALNAIDQNEKWLIIAEAWCGDAAQNVPYFNKMANHTDRIELKVVLRDDNLELMDQFLSNGARSIPKVIRMNENFEVLSVWGARPVACQEAVNEYKAAGNTDKDGIHKVMHGWYAKNKGAALYEETIALLNDTYSVQKV